ncbi:MAG: hypothetical protein H0W81_11935 [Chloroflexi bacterium]|nr:hypothetical protein [Chloroflexota bacterium]
MNRLYYGDNLQVMKDYLDDESVDLVYLDPPFNSNASYNVLFAEHDGTKAAAQIEAFGDTWKWDQAAAEAYADEARRRLGRLTAGQREVVEGAVERLAGEIEESEQVPSPFSAETTATLERLLREEACHWEITLPREDAGRLADPEDDSPSTQGIAWTCVLRWPTRVVRGEGPSAEEAMRAAFGAAGVTEPEELPPAS